MSKEMKRSLIGGTTLLASLSLFFGVALAPIWTEGADPAPGRVIEWEARDVAFGDNNPTLRFKAGERVRFVIRNTDPGVVHTITLPGIDDRVHHIDPYEVLTLDVTFADAGTYEYACPQHAPKMKGRIVVD
jgi:plastocyanin